MVEGRSLIEFLWIEVETEVGPCDGMSYGRNVRKLEVSGERKSIENGDM